MIKKQSTFIEIIYKVVYGLFNLQLSVTKVLGALIRRKSLPNDFALPFCEAEENVSNYYMGCSFKPKYTNDSMNQILSPKYDNCAIVIQGPIVRKNDFTLESIKLYNKIFPGAKIILSTWANENADVVNVIKNLCDCSVVLNSQPEFIDYLNLNRQVVTTLAGIHKAKELGCEYVLKTRTDFRFYRLDLFEYLIDIIEHFPVNDANGLKQKKRLICFKAGVFQPFYIPEFFNFGEIDDMINLWNIPLIKEHRVTDNLRGVKMSYHQVFDTHGVPEIELFTSYFTRMGINVECTIDCWWNIVQNYLVALPSIDVQAFWYKYHMSREESNIYDIYYRDDNTRNNEAKTVFNFGTWKSIYENKSTLYKKEYEKYIEAEF